MTESSRRSWSGKSYIAVAATPELARGTRLGETQADSRWKPTGKLHDAFEGLPDDLTFLAVSDHRESSVPEKIAGLPSMTQMLINMSEEEISDNASPWCILDMFGLPRPGGFQVKIDRSTDSHGGRRSSVPLARASWPRRSIERGCRLISRGAFPFALFARERIKLLSSCSAGNDRRGLAIQGASQLHDLRSRSD